MPMGRRQPLQLDKFTSANKSSNSSSQVADVYFDYTTDQSKIRETSFLSPRMKISPAAQTRMRYDPLHYDHTAKR